jgi:two-component system response regulator YesN
VYIASHWKSAGYEVEVAASAQDGAVLLGEGRHPDLLMTDIDMPNGHAMDGIVLARLARIEHPEMPILIVSKAAALGEKAALVRGPTRAVAKPVPMLELLKEVERLLLDR